MLIFRFIHYFAGYYLNRLTQKTLQFSHTDQCSSSILLCLKRTVLVPVSLRPSPSWTWSPLIGQITHTWASTTKRLHCQVVKPILKWIKSCNCVTRAWCRKVPGLKVGLQTRCFRGSAFCGNEELLLVEPFTFLSFFYMNKNISLYVYIY